MPTYNKPPDARKTRRFEIVYMALCGLRPQELMKLASDPTIDAVNRNAFIQELAWIVDDALQAEVERRRDGER